MRQLIQHSFRGINDLSFREVDPPTPAANEVLIKMRALPVTTSDIKREFNDHATAEQLTNLPRVIGVGGVGEVVQVGEQRDSALMHQRVLVLNPTGAYQEYLTSKNSNWLFPLSDNVSDEQALTLVGAGGTVELLASIIKKSSSQNIIITGANSVIGILLLQLLTLDHHMIFPLVNPSSVEYFQSRLPEAPVYTIDCLPKLTDATIIDIAGNTHLLESLSSMIPNIQTISIAITDNPQIQFVHEEFNRQVYLQLIEKLSTGELKGPVGKHFAFSDVKEAQHYTNDHHSRGRVYLTLN